MRFFALLALVLSIVGCGVEHKSSSPSALIVEGYDANITNPAPQPTPAETKLWVGDSYVKLGAWASWFPGSVNAGVGGNTVGMVLDRVKAMPSVPETVYVWCGVNDIQLGAPRAQTVEQYGQLIDTLKAKGAVTVICVSPLPVGTAYVDSFKALVPIGDMPTPPAVDLLNQQEAAIASQHGAHWIDARSAITGAGGWSDPAYCMQNGIHLTAIGYDRVVAAICEANHMPLAANN